MQPCTTIQNSIQKYAKQCKTRSLRICFISICLWKVKFLHRGLKWIAAQEGLIYAGLQHNEGKTKRTNHLQSSHHTVGLLVKCHIIQEGFKIHLFLTGQIPRSRFHDGTNADMSCLRFFHLGSSLCWRPIRHLLVYILNMNVKHIVRTKSCTKCASTSQSKCTHFPASMLFAFPETPILSSFLELARGGTQGGIPHYTIAASLRILSGASLARLCNASKTEAINKENDFELTMSAMSMRLNLASVLLALSVLCRSCPAKLQFKQAQIAECRAQYSRATCPFYSFLL